MNAVDTNDVLNLLSVIHSRSLPTYLTYATPWADGREEIKEALDGIAADHLNTVDRLAELIIENGANVAPGEYPMAYTSLHDLDIAYILKLVIDGQKRIVGQIDGCIDKLATAPLAKELAEEALGEAKGHLQILEELASAEA